MCGYGSLERDGGVVSAWVSHSGLHIGGGFERPRAKARTARSVESFLSGFSAGAGGTRRGGEPLSLASGRVLSNDEKSENVGGFVGCGAGTSVRCLIECLGRNVVDRR